METRIGQMRTRLRPALLLVVALLGVAAVAHGVDHLVAAPCEASQGPQAHACLVCSALHGAQLPDSGIVLAVPGPARGATALPAATRAPAPAPHRPGPPRAPPAA